MEGNDHRAVGNDRRRQIIVDDPDRGRMFEVKTFVCTTENDKLEVKTLSMETHGIA